MNIKAKLKQYDIKLFDFAKALKISRPTLNNYISTFEKENELPSEKYQLVFSKLFSDEINSKEAFNKEFTKFQKLLSRDDLLGTIDLNPKATDMMMSILKRIKRNFEDDDFEESIYIFINMLIGSYRRDPIFKQFANYFLYLNGKEDLNKVSEHEKIFISHCYKLMSLEKENKLVLDNEYYKKFENRVKEIKDMVNKNAKEKSEEIFKDEIKEKLDSEIQKQLSLGVHIEDIDVNKIVEKIGLTKKQ